MTSIKGGLRWPLILIGCFVTGAAVAASMLAGLIAPERAATHADKILLFGACLVFTIAAALFVQKAVRARDILVEIGPDGIRDRRVSPVLIPWSAVIDAEHVRISKADYVVLRLRPSFEAGRSFQATTTIGYRFRRLFGYLGVHIKGAGLRCRFAELNAAIQRGLEAWRRHQPGDKPNQPAEVADPSEIELTRTRGRTPWLTFILIGILSCIFLGEVGGGSVDDGLLPSPNALSRMGALDRYGIMHGQYWRLATAPLLHASVGHLFANCVALLLAGYLLEPIIGAIRLAAIFILCALCGGLASVWFNPASVETVGASGGIIGLMTFAFARAFTYPPGAMRSTFLVGSGRVLLPTLLGALAPRGSGHVDHAAHIGGGLAGLTLVLLFSAPHTLRRKPVASCHFGD